VTLDESGGVTAQLAAGMYGMAASGERLFFTALSQVGGPTNNNPALYAGDAQATCEGSGFDSAGAVDAWGLSTGPVAVDENGSLFAILTDFNEGTQEIRAFEAADVAPGAPATTGTPIATLDGYGDALAAIAPEGAAPGLLVVQPNDATDGSHGEVLAIEVTLDAGTFTGAAPVTLLDLTEDDDNVTLMTDVDGRLWVGLDAKRERGQPVSTFFVLVVAPRADSDPSGPFMARRPRATRGGTDELPHARRRSPRAGRGRRLPRGKLRSDSGGDCVFATRNSQYRVVEGTVLEASDTSLMGAELVAGCARSSASR
jgi:hypothetical protein